jgi:hypothetical protein
MALLCDLPSPPPTYIIRKPRKPKDIVEEEKRAPRKIVVPRKVSMTTPKAIQDAIEKQHMDCVHAAEDRCCKIHRDEVQLARQTYWALKAQTQGTWLLRKMHTHGDLLTKEQVMYTLGKNLLCAPCLRAVLGVSTAKWYKLRKQAKDGAVTMVSERTGGDSRQHKKQASVYQWMDGYIQDQGQYMPDVDKMFLPPGNWTTLYEEYKREVPDGSTLSYFRTCVQENYKNLIHRRGSSFTKCATCINFNVERRKTTDRDKLRDIQRRKGIHRSKYLLERRKYYKHRRKGKKAPQKYLSVIIDGMDQSKTWRQNQGCWSTSTEF